MGGSIFPFTLHKIQYQVAAKLNEINRFMWYKYNDFCSDQLEIEACLVSL